MGAAAFAMQAAPQSRAQPQSLELSELSITQLQEGLTTGRWTSSHLVEQYFTRIASIDKQGPRINSVLELNPDALSIAAALDRERKEKGPRGPLHGIPVLIKDNIDTGDKMMTSAGSLALATSAPKDAELVTRLRAAGAIILGKTNLSEWANFRSSHSTSGWSGRGGQTRQSLRARPQSLRVQFGIRARPSRPVCAPRRSERKPTAPSFRPRRSTASVGIKPTVGLIPGAGIVPISHRQDTAGPMARTVADAAILLGALTGASYGQALDPNGLSGARIGVARQIFGFNDHVDRIIGNRPSRR